MINSTRHATHKNSVPGRVFCFYTPTVLIYSKEALTIDEQIAQLEARGLVIVDKSLASHYMRTISYYRLAGYWWPMQKDPVNHSFKEGSTFEDVIFLYDFDRELRILLFDVIERIEIGLRTMMIYHLSHEKLLF